MRRAKILMLVLICCLFLITAGSVSGEVAADVVPPADLEAAVVSSSQIDLTWADNSSDEMGFIIERKTGDGAYVPVHTAPENSIMFADTGLSANTAYTYRVMAYNSTGNSAYSNEAYATTAGTVPAAPANLAATMVSSSTIIISWTDNSNDESGFKIERRTQGGSYSLVTTVGANATSYTNTGLTSGTTYYYRVRAYNSAGDSAYSNESYAVTGVVLPAPSGLAAVAVSTSRIDLTWEDNSNNETGFKIERRTEGGAYTQIATVGANVTGIVNTGLANGTRYHYRVRAYNAAGNSTYSNESSAVTGIVLAAPSGLRAVAVSASRIDLTWEDNSGSETGFKIERRTENGTFSQVATVGANVSGYASSGLTNNTRYYYRVRAYNAAGDSTYSNESYATTGVVLAAPSGLAAVAVSSSRIDLTWNDNSNNESGFKVERKTEGGTYTQIATVGANVTSYAGIGLANNTRYYYRVRAYSAAGDSTYSNESYAVTGSMPAAPSGLKATALSSSIIRLSWDDKSSNENGFKIERREAGGSYSQIASVGASITAYNNSGLSENTRYYYRVRAFNNNGDSPYTSEVSAVTNSIPRTIIKLTIDKTAYYVGSQLRYMDTAPVIMENRTLLPVRYVAEAIGALVTWNYAEQKVTVTLNNKVIELWIGKHTARVNGQYVLIDPYNLNVSPVVIPPGRTMLPLRFISESLGASVDWDQTQREVTVTYTAP